MKFLRDWLVPRPTIRDDRGQEVPFFFEGDSECYHGLPPVSDEREPPPREPKWRIALALLVGPPMITLILATFLAIVAGVFFLAWLSGAGVARLLDAPGWVGGGVAVVGLPAAVLFAPAILRRLPGAARRMASQSRRYAAARLSEGACGSCGHSIVELPVDRDGCTRCTECGAAWICSDWRDESANFCVHPERGTDWTVIDARGLGRLALARHPAEHVRRLFREVGRSVRMSYARCVGYASTFLLAAAIVGLFAMAGLGMWLLFPVLSFGLLAWVLVYHHHSAVIRKAAARVFVDGAVARWTCPQCDGPLRRTVTKSDGVLLCEECRAAWRPSGAGRE